MRRKLYGLTYRVSVMGEVFSASLVRFSIPLEPFFSRRLFLSVLTLDAREPNGLIYLAYV